MKCQIKWVDANGQATPDENEAIGHVYREAYVFQNKYACHGAIKFEETEHFAICAEHAKRLNDRGMEHWRFIPNEVK